MDDDVLLEFLGFNAFMAHRQALLGLEPDAAAWAALSVEEQSKWVLAGKMFDEAMKAVRARPALIGRTMRPKDMS